MKEIDLAIKVDRLRSAADCAHDSSLKIRRQRCEGVVVTETEKVSKRGGWPRERLQTSGVLYRYIR